MRRLILHIPHASKYIPIMDGFVAGEDVLQQEILKLTDWFTDNLFFSETDLMVVAPFSRIFCDVERFANNSHEPMAKFGMGALYEKTDNGKALRKVSQELRDNIIEKYYLKHHEKLNSVIKEQLAKHKSVTIIDCHSFSNTPFERDINKSPNRPDVNIGTDPFHTPKELVDFTVEFFTSKGYTIGIDWPYSRTMVPSMYYKKNRNVYSIMIEVNRKLYLMDNTNLKSSGYNKLKNDIQLLMENLRSAQKIFDFF